MQLTRHTDYALRTLLLLAAAGDRSVTADEVAARFNVNRNHLRKVVNRLAQLGYVEARRGPKGGLRLAREPARINLAQVVDDFEPHVDLLECFDDAANTCPANGSCSLKGVLKQARGAFLSVLLDHSLADLMGDPRRLLNLLPDRRRA